MNKDEIIDKSFMIITMFLAITSIMDDWPIAIKVGFVVTMGITWFVIGVDYGNYWNETK